MAASTDVSVISLEDRRVELKIHQCVWSGQFPGNSLAAILDCYRAHVSRAEIDIAMLPDTDFVVVHDVDAPGEHAPRLSEVVDVIRDEPFPTLLELDLKDDQPWPWRRAEELARLVGPVRDRITFGGDVDFNLRRLHVVDPALRLGYTLPSYRQWRPERVDNVGHRFDALLNMVPGARDLHVRLEDALAIIGDGVPDLVHRVHTRGMLLDTWTINAGTPRWRERLYAALELGADIITTETPRALIDAAAPLVAS